MGFTIGDAIQSVIDQTFKDWILYIADGGSTDDTVKVAKSFTDSRVHCFIDTNTPMGRMNKAFNLTVNKYATFLAADDRFEPTFLEENLNVFEQHPDIDLVYNSYSQHRFNNKLECLGSKECKLSTLDQGNLNTGMFMGVFWLFTRDLFNKVGGFTGPMSICFDYAFVLKCEYYGAKFYYLDKSLGWYRSWDESDTGKSTPQKFWLMGEKTREYEFKRRIDDKRNNTRI